MHLSIVLSVVNPPPVLCLTTERYDFFSRRTKISHTPALLLRPYPPHPNWKKSENVDRDFFLPPKKTFFEVLALFIGQLVFCVQKTWVFMMMVFSIMMMTTTLCVYVLYVLHVWARAFSVDQSHESEYEYERDHEREREHERNYHNDNA